MDLTHLSDEEVKQGLTKFVKSERESLTGVLHYLREVERRRLYCEYKCSSLFEFAMKVHNYSEQEANSRISAMRLLKEIPQIEEKIEKGALSLTNLVSARAMFRKEKKAAIHRTIEQKIEVLKKLEHCTKAKAEKVLQTESFLAPMFDLEVKVIERSFFSDDESEAVLKRLFELKAHSHPNMSLRDLFMQMAEVCLRKWDPVEKAKRSETRKSRKQKAKAKVIEASDKTTETSHSPFPEKVEKPNRHYPAVVRHAVYMRDQGRCRNCGSGRATEIDHVVPFAMGGSADLENLRLLCRSCNQRHAIQTYGVSKMQSYLRAPSIGYRATIH